MRRNTEEMKDALGPNKETKSTKPARVHNKEHGGCRGEWNVLIFKLDVLSCRGAREDSLTLVWLSPRERGGYHM